jgi:hypothetical protein
VTRSQTATAGWLVVAAVGVSILLTIWPRTTSFHLSLETERVDLRLGDAGPIIWRFEGAKLFRGFAPLGGQAPAHSSDRRAGAPGPELFSGEVRSFPGVDLQVARIGYGDLRFRFQAREPGQPVALLYPEDRARDYEMVEDRLVLTVEGVPRVVAERGTLVFMVVGRGRLGSDVMFDNRFGTSILRSGQISWLEESYLGGASYLAGELKVDPGDVIEAGSEALLWGALIVDENAAMKAILDVEAPVLEVHRASNRSLHLSTSWLARIRNDSSVQLAWSTTILLIGLRALLRTHRHEKDPVDRRRRRPARLRGRLRARLRASRHRASRLRASGGQERARRSRQRALVFAVPPLFRPHRRARDRKRSLRDLE